MRWLNRIKKSCISKMSYIPEASFNNIIFKSVILLILKVATKNIISKCYIYMYMHMYTYRYVIEFN